MAQTRLTLPRLLEPLRGRHYRRYWLASAVSFAGDGVYLVAVVWHAAGLDNSALALSLVGVATTAPGLVATLFGGALADRLERRLLLIISDVIRALAIGAMALLAWAGLLELPYLLVLVTAFGLASAVANPTITAYLPSLVNQAGLRQANALLSMTRTLAGRIIGPAVGGSLIALGGVEVCFLLDALSFLVSAWALVFLPAHQALASSKRLLAQVVEGLRFARAHDWLWMTLATSTFGLLFYVGPYYVLAPLLIKDSFSGGAQAYSVLLAIGGLAAILGAALAGHVHPKRPLVWAYSCWIISMIAYSVYGVVPSLPALYLAAAVSLGAGVTGGVIWLSLLQERVPDHVLGRVASLDSLATVGLMPLSMALAGPAAALFGPQAVFIAGGCLAAAIHALGGLAVLRSYRRDTLNAVESPAEVKDAVRYGEGRT